MSELHVETARELATHAAEIRHLQDNMDKLVADMEEIKRTLTTINSTLAEAKGGWRVLMLVGGSAAAIGGLAAELLPSLFRLGK